MYYKGIELNPSQINKSWTLNDVPEKALGTYSDVLPRNNGESNLSYRQRIVNHLNALRQKMLSSLASVTHNSDKLELRNTNFNANPGQNIFRTRDTSTPQEAFLHAQRKGIPYKNIGPREFTTLDIETDDKGRPITISALKQVFNRDTGQFETVDSYQRFYHAKNSNLRESSAVHGLTAAKLKRLRSQQARRQGNIGYSKDYNEAEAERLKAFLGNSIIVGHNIVDFDLPHLFKSPINNQVIDTLIASRNQWRNKKNDLDSVFKRLFGKTMSQAGLSHHDSMADVIATAMIMQRMALMKGDTGDSLRYVMTHAGVHIAPKDDYIKSQIINGTYNQYTNLERYMKMDDDHVKIEDIVNKNMLGGKYNEDTRSYDLPEGMHYEDEYPITDTFDDDSMLMAQSLAEVARELKRSIQRSDMVSQEAKEAYALGNMSRMQQTIRSLANFDNEKAMKAELAAAYGITNEDEQRMWIDRALEHRKHILEQRSRNAAKSSVEKAKWKAEREGRTGDLEVLENIDGTYTQKEVWNLLHEIEDNKKEEKRKEREAEKRYNQAEHFGNYKSYMLRHLGRHYNLDDWRKDFMKTTDRYEFDEVLDRMKVEKARDKKMRQFEKSGLLTKNDRALLDAADNMEDFNEAAEQVANRMGRINNAFAAFAKIPMYNFERLEAAFKGEVGGIKSAARGIVPNILYSPFSRLTDASLNAMTGHYAGLKYGVRAGSAIGGGLLAAGGALTATGAGTIPGLIMMGIGGTVGAISQIVGNRKEAGITRWGEGIQNNLNTLGFLQDMILMPFRLLKIAIDGVLKGLKLFAGTLKSLVNIVGVGMGTLSNMGNPLTEMTGVSYGDYIGLNSIDAASLLGKGTVNSIMNDFAQQRMKLYTTGQVDTNRLVAASMLGIFDETYGYRANDEDAVSGAIDRVYSTMRGMNKNQKKQWSVLTTMVNPNLASILQTMETLGVSSVEDLKRPSSMWGYSNEALDGYRSRFQRAQWEYNYGNSQFDITKGRIASSLWNGPMGFSISGRGLMNGFNKVMKSVADALDTGDWSSVGNTIKNTWEIIKDGANEVWESVKKAFGIESTKSIGEYLKDTVVGWGASIADILKNKVLPIVNNLWDQITDIIIDKFTGLATYLSTIKVDWNEFYKQVVKGEKSDKPWITSLGDNKFNMEEFRSVDIYNKFVDISRDYDKKYGINNLWQVKDQRFDPNLAMAAGSGVESYEFTTRGKVMQGIPNIIDTINPENSTKHLQDWLSNTLRTGSAEQIEYLNELIQAAGLSEVPNLRPGQNGEEFLNYLIQHGVKAAAANALHGNKWGNIQYDTDNDSLNRGVDKIVNEYRALRDPVTGGVIDAVGSTLSALTGLQVQDPALLKIEFRDDKGNAFAGAEVKMSGKVDTRTYNGFVDLESRDGIFNFQVSQQMRGSR